MFKYDKSWYGLIFRILLWGPYTEIFSPNNYPHPIMFPIQADKKNYTLKMRWEVSYGKHYKTLYFDT